MLLLFILSGTSAVFGNFFLKLGINHLKNFEFTIQSLTSVATNWQIVLGFILYGTSSLLYLKLLSQVEVSRVYPALVGYMAIVILVLGAMFLKEPLTLTKFLGVLVIVLGIFLITR